MNRMEKIIVGWREWLALPSLNIAHIKAKIDTGARTSSLHAFSVEPYLVRGASMVSVKVHPYQNNTSYEVAFDAEVVDRRWVSDSGGHKEKRYVIMAAMQLGHHSWESELTLTNRDTMKFRMLLGRTAMDGRLLVDPAASYLAGRRPKSKHKKG
jgi:hypothetical protein